MHERDDKPKIILPPGVSYSPEDDATPPPPAGSAAPAGKPAPEPDPAPTDDADPIGEPANPEAQLRAELQMAQERASGLEKELALLRAEFENFRKRLQRTTDERIRFATQPLVGDLLRVVDDLDRALKAADNSDDKPLREGVQMIRDAFVAILGSHGVAPVPSEGEPFDPNLHEAVSVQESTGVPTNTILEVFSQGYTLHDRVIRASKVVVSQNPSETAAAPPEPANDTEGPVPDSPDGSA